MATATTRVKTRRPLGQLAVRSIRVSDETWATARERAIREGFTISNVVALLVEGFALGAIDLPHVSVTYSQTRPGGEDAPPVDDAQPLDLASMPKPVSAR